MSATSYMSALMVLMTALLAAVVQYTHSTSLLIIGDSVDRYSAIEYCRFHRSKYINWGDKTIEYIYAKEAAIPFCRDEVNNNSVAFFHIYGSRPHRPYYNFIQNHSKEMVYDSVPRIKRGIEMYTRRFGIPDRVIFHTTLWDVQFYQTSIDDLEKKLETSSKIPDGFRQDTTNRLNEVQTLLGPTVDVGVRTAVWVKKGGALLTLFNDIIRDIAKERQCTIYDLDADVWEAVQNVRKRQDTILRDWVHPKLFFTRTAAEVLVGQMFSTNFRTSKEKTFPSVISSLRPYEHIDVRYLETEGDGSITYYTARNLYVASAGTGTTRATQTNVTSLQPGQRFRCGVLNRDYHFTSGCCSRAYAMKATKDVVESIPHLGLAPDVVRSLNNNTRRLGLVTKTNQTYVVFANGFIRKAPSFEVMSIYQPNRTHVFWDYDDECLPLFFQDEEIPDIYKNGSLIRHFFSKQVYMIDGHLKRPINSAAVMQRYGFSYKDIRIIEHFVYVDALITGPPVK